MKKYESKRVCMKIEKDVNCISHIYALAGAGFSDINFLKKYNHKAKLH
jgi:hypothetical protein